MKRVALLCALLLAAGALQAADGNEVRVKQRTHGCKSPDQTYKFWSLARDRKEAAARFSNEKGCLMIPEGTPVVVVERDPIAKMNGIQLVKGDDKSVYYVPSSDAN